MPENSIGKAVIEIGADASDLGSEVESQASGELKQAGDRLGKNTGDAYGKGMKSRLGSLAKGIFAGIAAAGAAAASVALGSWMKGAIQEASDLNEAGTALEAVFGKQAVKAVNDFASKGADALGQTTVEVLNAAKTFGIYGKAAGLAADDNAAFSTELVQLSTDLASFHNAEPQEVVEALGSALRGEAEPMRRFGVLLDDATLKAKAMELGLYDGEGALSQQAKILSANKVILEQTADAQGDFAKTSEGLANVQRRLSAGFTDLKGVVGGIFAPALATIGDAVAEKVLPMLGKLVDTYAPRLEAFFTNQGEKIAEFVRNFDFEAAIAKVGDFVDRVRGWFANLSWDQVGAEASGVWDSIKEAFDGIDWSVLGEGLTTIKDAFADLGGALSDNSGALLEALADGAEVFGDALGWLSENMDTIIQFLPALIALWAAYKVAQTGTQAVEATRLPTMALQAAANLSLAASNRALMQSQRGLTASTAAMTASQTTNTAATNVGLFARIRQTAATVAQRVATVAATVAQKVATAAQWLWNAALSANPIGLIIAAVAALVAALVWFFTQTELGRTIWEGFINWLVTAWEWVKETAITVWTAISDFFVALWDGIKNTFMTVFNFIKALITTYFTIYKTVITTVFNAVKTFIVTVWNYIKGAFTTVFNAIKSVFTTAFNAYKTVVLTVFNAVKSFITTVWDSIRSKIATVVNAIRSVISTVLNGIKSVWSSAWNTVKEKVVSIWDGIKTAVSTAINSVMDRVKTIKTRITGFFSGAVNWLKDAGRKIIDGLASGIRNAVGKVTDAISTVTQKVRDFLPFSPAKVGPFSGRGWTPYSGEALVEGLAQGISDSAPVLNKAMDGALSGLQTQVGVTAPAMASRAGTAAPTASTASGPVSVSVHVSMDDLAQLKTFEDFMELLQVRTRMGQGA